MPYGSLEDDYHFLLTQKIYSILIGDTPCGNLDIKKADNTFVKAAMPYLSGRILCEISNNFGIDICYPRGGGAKSRWEYMEDLLRHCIQERTVTILFKFLFEKNKFVTILSGVKAEDVDRAYSEVVKLILDRLNEPLAFRKKELVIIGDDFFIKPVGKNVTIPMSHIRIKERPVIADRATFALKDVADGHYDSALTKARSLLEEVLRFIIERKNETPQENPSINNLFHQAKQLYNMHNDKNTDHRFNLLVTGLDKILSAISELRNTSSDAHGFGANRVILEEHHARLAVNAAIMFAEFMLAVSDRNISKNSIETKPSVPPPPIKPKPIIHSNQ